MGNSFCLLIAFFVFTFNNQKRRPNPSASLSCSRSVCSMFWFVTRKWVAIASVRRSLLHSLMQNRFFNTTTSTSTLSSTSSSSSSSSFTVQFLVNSCGLPLQSALSASKKLQLNENKLQNPHSVLEFLKSRNFDGTHVAKLVEKWPPVLLSSVENTLKPKFEYLIRNGFTGQLLPQLLTSNTVILRRALESQIKPAFEFLVLVLGSNEKIVEASKRSSWLLTTDMKRILQPNFDFLIREGIPANNVAKIILSWPRVMIQKHDRIVYAVKSVKNFGLDPKAPIFVHAFRVMIQMGESTWKKKIEVMKSLGWSEEEILKGFRRSPFFLSCSEEKIRSSMDFLVNSMKLSPQTIIETPNFLTYSIDKRLRPRHNVFKVLKSNKLIKDDQTINRLLSMSDKNFLEGYVTKYLDRLPGLLEIHQGANNTRTMYT